MYVFRYTLYLLRAHFSYIILFDWIGKNVATSKSMDSKSFRYVERVTTDRLSREKSRKIAFLSSGYKIVPFALFPQIGR